MLWFTSLATEVQLAIIGILGTAVGAILAVWRESKKPPEKTAPTMAIAGALIDASKADEVVRTVEAESKAVRANTVATRDNTVMASKLHDEIGEARNDMRSLTQALERMREEMRIQREMDRG